MKFKLSDVLRPFVVFCLFAVTTSAHASSYPPTVAVLYFDYQGKDESLAVLKKGMAQMLITDLGGQAESCIFVERERLEEILAELKLGSDGKFDPKTAAKVGKLLGARYIILGSFFDLMGQFRVDSRLLEVETGSILGATGKMGKADDFWALEQAIAEDLANLLKAKAKPVAGVPPKNNRKKKRVKRQRKRVKKTKVSTAVVMEYSRALDAKDRGDTQAAKAALKKIVKETPSFDIAAIDLGDLLQ
jgi:TolB-like protein